MFMNRNFGGPQILFEGEGGGSGGSGDSGGGGGGGEGSAGGSGDSGGGDAGGGDQGGKGDGAGGGDGSVPKWTDTLDESGRDFVNTKGFDGVPALLSSYKNLEKLIGVKEQVIELPKDASTDEGKAKMGELYTRLGKPKEAKEYNFKIDEKIGGEKLEEFTKNLFHKANLTGAQAELIMKEWGENTNSIVTQHTEQQKFEGEKAIKDLRVEWGAAYDNNAQMVEKTAEKFGMDQQQLLSLRSAMGPAGAMKFMYNLGSKVGEANFIEGGGGDGNAFGTLSPGAAQARILELKKDKTFVEKLMNKDIEAKKEMDRLHQMAHPSS